MSKQLGSKVLMLRPDPIKTRGLLEKKREHARGTVFGALQAS